MYVLKVCAARPFSPQERRSTHTHTGNRTRPHLRTLLLRTPGSKIPKHNNIPTFEIPARRSVVYINPCGSHGLLICSLLAPSCGFPALKAIYHEPLSSMIRGSQARIACTAVDYYYRITACSRVHNAKPFVSRIASSGCVFASASRRARTSCIRARLSISAAWPADPLPRCAEAECSNRSLMMAKKRSRKRRRRARRRAELWLSPPRLFCQPRSGKVSREEVGDVRSESRRRGQNRNEWGALCTSSYPQCLLK